MDFWILHRLNLIINSVLGIQCNSVRNIVILHTKEEKSSVLSIRTSAIFIDAEKLSGFSADSKNCP